MQNDISNPVTTKLQRKRGRAPMDKLIRIDFEQKPIDTGLDFERPEFDAKFEGGVFNIQPGSSMFSLVRTLRAYCGIGKEFGVWAFRHEGAMYWRCEMIGRRATSQVTIHATGRSRQDVKSKAHPWIEVVDAVDAFYLITLLQDVMHPMAEISKTNLPIMRFGRCMPAHLIDYKLCSTRTELAR